MLDEKKRERRGRYLVLGVFHALPRSRALKQVVWSWLRNWTRQGSERHPLRLACGCACWASLARGLSPVFTLLPRRAFWITDLSVIPTVQEVESKLLSVATQGLLLCTPDYFWFDCLSSPAVFTVGLLSNGISGLFPLPEMPFFCLFSSLFCAPGRLPCIVLGLSR